MHGLSLVNTVIHRAIKSNTTLSPDKIGFISKTIHEELFFKLSGTTQYTYIEELPLAISWVYNAHAIYGHTYTYTPTFPNSTILRIATDDDCNGNNESCTHTLYVLTEEQHKCFWEIFNLVWDLFVVDDPNNQNHPDYARLSMPKQYTV